MREDFKKIMSIQDLNKRHLTLSDYNTLRLLIYYLDKCKQCEYIQQSIKNYFDRFNELETIQTSFGYITRIKEQQ